MEWHNCHQLGNELSACVRLRLLLGAIAGLVGQSHNNLDLFSGFRTLRRPNETASALLGPNHVFGLVVDRLWAISPILRTPWPLGMNGADLCQQTEMSPLVSDLFHVAWPILSSLETLLFLSVGMLNESFYRFLHRAIDTQCRPITIELHRVISA